MYVLSGKGMQFFLAVWNFDGRDWYGGLEGHLVRHLAVISHYAFTVYCFVDFKGSAG